MDMHLLSEEEVKQQAVQIVQKYLGAMHGLRLFLFGSRARKTASVRSDYDFGIQYVSTLERNEQTRNEHSNIPLNVLSRIEGELEDIHIMQTIDFVDLDRVSNDFRIAALKDAELLLEVEHGKE
jgi:predicted nucleotidyltransferase